MSIYFVVLNFRIVCNNLPKTYIVETEVEEAKGRFKRLRKFPDKFVDVNHYVDFLPSAVSKKREYTVCKDKSMIYMFGRNKEELLNTWKATMSPDER